ncbi:MAG: hypothetical protein Q8Q92_01830, partial [bacterium]|nr:hypothetical protein [bacterium]
NRFKQTQLMFSMLKLNVMAKDMVIYKKFMRLLKELARETQFIIITHNRETMRHADALYGVSMKDGISHLLSLKLQSA